MVFTGYYQRHGFIDVIEDMPQHAVERRTPDQHSEQCFVRVAELSDAAHLLALYMEHNQASMYFWSYSHGKPPGSLPQELA
jgi:hypothetical protein